MGPQVHTATFRTVMSTNRDDSGVLAHDGLRFDVQTRAQTLFGYIGSD